MKPEDMFSINEFCQPEELFDLVLCHPLYFFCDILMDFFPPVLFYLTWKPKTKWKSN